MTDRRKAILVEAARDLAEMQEGSDAGWGLWYDWLDTVVRRVEREAGEEYHVLSAVQWTNGLGGRGTDLRLGEHIALEPGDRVRVVKEGA